MSRGLCPDSGGAVYRLWRKRRLWRPRLGLCGRRCHFQGLPQAALWAGSLWVEPCLQLVLWALALAQDILTTFLVASETHHAPPHPEHLPERFGLFTIILLGEAAVAAVDVL
ncbi:hypothetical protein B6V75_00095 [Thioclava sp. F1Mire-8]|nr:hypothetical protein B6V75_00095 [Thioclava sp. F1Mire-8]